jgi:hypothetical protein
MEIMDIKKAIAAGIAALASAGAHGQWWNPADMTPPYLRGTPQASKVALTPVLYDVARHQANAAFWNQDFKKLDRMYDEFVRDGARATDGIWMVEAIQETFQGLFMAADEGMIQRYMAAWEKSAPESKLRPVIEAMQWEELAWKARGNEARSMVEHALESSQDVGKDSPIWYWIALIVAGSSGRSAAEQDALFEVAVKRFPSYQPLYYTRMNYLLPQWGGSYDAVERFVRASVARTSETEGSALYAWLYVDLGNGRKNLGGDLFEVTKVSWPSMKKGFEDLVARYPADTNKNLFATYACRARDKETTGRLLTELGAKAKLGSAAQGISTESCRRFALTPA